LLAKVDSEGCPQGEPSGRVKIKGLLVRRTQVRRTSKPADWQSQGAKRTVSGWKL